MSVAWEVRESNPNVQGGGCLCYAESNPDQPRGRVAVNYCNEMDSGLSPHVVLCEGCPNLKRLGVGVKFKKGVETHAAGDFVVDSTAVEIVEPDRKGAADKS